MRFLFGIFTGAALTLLIATTADAPTNPVVNQITSLWQQLITSTGERLFQHRPESTSTPQSAADSRMPSVNELPLIEPVLSKAAEPIPAVPEPTTNHPATLLPHADPNVREEASVSEAVLQEPEVAVHSEEDSAALDVLEEPANNAAIETLVAQAAAQLESMQPTTRSDPAVPGEHQLAAVWVPFHSERSASGFARSLSRHFAHPFTVQRTGPGAYQVSFAYADPVQREQMLSEIAELTGQ